MYVLNLKTETLHIENMCHCFMCDIKRFRTEQEATEYAGKFMKMCKLCERKKEKTLKEKKK